MLQTAGISRNAVTVTLALTSRRHHPPEMTPSIHIVPGNLMAKLAPAAGRLAVYAWECKRGAVATCCGLRTSQPKLFSSPSTAPHPR